jgi:pimeloyl-ACP methyl ester carboxylesterase
MGLALRTLLTAAALAALVPGAARAAVDFAPCPDGADVQCGSVGVPIDRTGAVPGTIALHVERVPARAGATAPPVMAVIGGPGKPDTNYTRDYVELLGPALDSRDLIVFDPRGTGGSGEIGCAAIELEQPPAEAMPACAQQLGPAANHYTTVANADDMESVRAALGVERVTVFARAYGGFQAQVFARRHPGSVASLILDSTAAPSTIDDGIGADVFRNFSGAFRRYCARGACRGLTRDAWADGVKLYRRLLQKPLKARVFDGAGRRRTIEIGAVPFALLVYGSYVHAEQRAELPRAIKAALSGDSALLARLLTIEAQAPADPKREANATVNLITQCEEVAFHFDRSAAPQRRIEQARAALAAVPESVFEPFGRELAYLNSLTETCAHWPMLAQRPDFGGVLPDVPALLFHGEQDLSKTPGETAEVAAALPQARVLEVPQTAHAVWITDVTGCVRRNVRAFLRGTAVGECRPVGSSPYGARPLPPRKLDGTPRRVLTAVRATVADGFYVLDDAARRVAAARNRARIGGLRGGRIRGGAKGPTFREYEYVDGVEVSGRVPRTGAVVLTVSGTWSGSLRFTPSGAIRGRLEGRPVRARGRLVRATPYESLRRRGLVPG